MRSFILGISTLFGLIGFNELASAQPTPGISTYRPPAVSPYLNLLRSGSSPAINYFDLVRPQIQTDQAIQGLSTDVSQNRQALTVMNTSLSATGHPTQFMNLGGYFNNNVGSNTGATVLAGLPGAGTSYDLSGTPYGAGSNGTNFGGGLNGSPTGGAGLNNNGPLRR